MRFHSANIVRIHWARSGTSMSARRSTAIVQPSSLLKALIQSCRFIRTSICRASRNSASFSAARCMYPITGSARVMTSPSSSSTTRSTPCVDGCCGPMLRIISSVVRLPAGTTSTSSPPPRIIEVTWILERGALVGVHHGVPSYRTGVWRCLAGPPRAVVSGHGRRTPFRALARRAPALRTRQARGGVARPAATEALRRA